MNSDDMDDSELLAKLDQAETRAAKVSSSIHVHFTIIVT